MMLGDIIPNFKAETTGGPITFYEYMGEGWCVILSHPGDFTPVCTTELAAVTKNIAHFTARNTKVVAISFDTVANHQSWAKDINAYNKDDPSKSLPFIIVADPDRTIGVQLGMIRDADKGKSGLALTARHAQIVGPDKKLKCSFVYPATTGRDLDEICRALDSVQLTEKHGVSTPVDWRPTGKILVPANIPPEKAQHVKNITIEKLPSGKKYLQFGELKESGGANKKC